ncbi:MAG: serine/threonine-protein kinase PknK, partial [Proteobacteria bacterium]|nr:serine/threonine-protein kinase PknK [Pseudomonadota bacterium]
VALKIIQTATLNNPRIRKCFEREARAFNLLHHPGIVEIYDYGLNESEQLYIAMEYIRGTSLHKLRDVAMPLCVVIDIICQILDALSLAHARGLIHCDLKAENVLVTVIDDRIVTKLVDFGLASLPYDSSAMHDSTFGTPAYMAPEQILGQVSLIAPCTDIYAVGIMLYELLSGMLPFDEKTQFATMNAQVNCEIPEIAWQSHTWMVSDEVREALTQIVRTAMNKKPWCRYISAEEFKMALLTVPVVHEEFDAAVFEKLRSDLFPTHSGEPSGQIVVNNISEKIVAVKEAEDSSVSSEKDSVSEDAIKSDVSEIYEDSFDAKFVAADSFFNELVHKKEYATLTKDAERALIGFGRIRVISAGFGLGKTRFVRYFSTHALNGKFAVIDCPVQLYHTAKHKKRLPDEIDLLLFEKTIAQLLEVFQDSARKDGIKQTFAGWRATDDDLLRELKSRIAGELPLDEQLGQALGEFVQRLVVEACKVKPVLMLLDDLQRCGGAVYRLLERLRAEVERLPVLILVTYDEHELASHRALSVEQSEFAGLFKHQIVLKPLSEALMVQMLSTCAHIEPKLSFCIAQVSFGNPYYAAAIVQNLTQSSRLIKNQNGQLELAPDDEQPLGVPRLVVQFFRRKLAEVALTQGTQCDLYREVLNAISVFGIKMTFRELEVFWQNDEDQALSACWRRAVDSWIQVGMLYSFSERNGEKGVAFTEPWLVDVVQAEMLPRRISALKAQAAMALVEACDHPDAWQSWRIAQLWHDADDMVSFIQCCQQSADRALEVASLRFAFERFCDLADIYDELLDMDMMPLDIVKAISWPTFLVHGAELCLMLDRMGEFDMYCQRLKLWQEKFNVPACLAHIQRLNAKKQLRSGQYSRAAETARHSHESFSICNLPDEAARSQIVLADAQAGMNDPRNARQILQMTLTEINSHDANLDKASLNIRLAEFEFFAGNIETAASMASNAVDLFHSVHTLLNESRARFTRDMIEWVKCPDDAAYLKVKDDYDVIAAQGDEAAAFRARMFMLIIATLHGDKKTSQALAVPSDSKTPAAALLAGTQGCIRGINKLFQDEDEAESDITMAIASFGPLNRRARAWCHTLIGVHTIVTGQLRKGVQAFERARNDFMALQDNIGFSTVLVGQSALAYACEQYDDAFSISLDVVRATRIYSLHTLECLAFPTLAMSCLMSGKLEQFKGCLPKKAKLIPNILYPLWHERMKEVVTAYANSEHCSAELDEIQNFMDNMPCPATNSSVSGYPSVEINP